MAEMKGFVIVVSFLLIYSALLGTMPAGFTATSYESPANTGIDSQLISGFDSYVAYNGNSTYFTAGQYDYDFGGWYWSALDFTSSIQILRRYPIFIFWGYEAGDFTFEGADRGSSISWAELQTDATDGVARYTFTTPAVSSGVVFYWNTSDYVYCWNAWGNDTLQVTHGIGASSYAPQNALSVVLSMLTFSYPDIPVLLQVILNSPIYACILFLVWFFIKEVIPFV